MSDNVEKIINLVVDLLNDKIDKLKDEITEICKSEVESNNE